ncbi:hypothetical protein JTB14_027098 [Gonioctena quinquepunctata]|nr:hypothetical protein JTB14_027098 [Gonioctena quinquepunctata]
MEELCSLTINVAASTISRINEGVRSVWGENRLPTENINTNNHQPIAPSPHRMTPAKKFLPKADLDRLPDEGVMEEYENSCATGKSAAYQTFGRELRTPDDVRSDFRTITEEDNEGFFTCGKLLQLDR